MLWDCFWGHFGTAVVATWLVEYCIQFLAGPCVHLLSQLTSNFHNSRYWGWQNSRWGDITRQLSSTWTSDLFMHAFTRVLSSQWRKTLMHMFHADLHEQTRIAATRFVLTMVILSSIEASGPVLNGRTLKMHSWAVFKIFLEAKRGVWVNPLEPPLPTDLCWGCVDINMQ